MFRLKISVATASFRQQLRQSLNTAGRAGARGVQFDLRNEVKPIDYGETARRQLLHVLRERDLIAAAAHFPLRGPLTDPERLDERIEALHEAIRFAAQLKIRVLTFRPGTIPEPDDPLYADRFLPILSDLAATANHQGVLPCLILTANPSDRVQSLIADVKTGPVGVDADLGGWVMHSEPPAEQLRELHAVVGHVQIRDAIRSTDGSGKEVPVGRGEVDWDEIAALLEEMDYSGWLTVLRTAGEDPIGDISRAIQYLKNLMPYENG